MTRAAFAVIAVATALMAAGPSKADDDASPLSEADLATMSIEQLAKIDVTSVSKTPEPLSDAAAAVYVITHDEIVRSGAVSLPEILRLASNLQVIQTSASSYVITARGFNGNQAYQSFSDKLLVLIDGRSVYTPLFSGVYWDMQDVLPEDIDRIEVISGPGAALWGANAVNGVVNIITRKASQTQGLYADAEGGNQQATFALRYGGHVGDALSYRVYARGLLGGDTFTSDGSARADDHWNRPQGGFRIDWAASSHDSVTFQGDGYRADEAEAAGPEQILTGANVMARWNHAWNSGATLQLQAYYDRTTRSAGGGFHLDTYDVDLQNAFRLGARNDITWGGGLRIERYLIGGGSSLFFTPPSRALNLSNFFVQDSISLTPALTLVAGLKLENDPYSGLAVLPNVRLSWKPTDDLLFWGAISRAIRSPTPFDRDVDETLGGILFLKGGTDFQPETLTAYEAGVRATPLPGLSFSVSGFYNVYGDLRTIEFSPVTLLPLVWGNRMRGDTFGFEAWANARLTPWWRIGPAFDLLHEKLSFTYGSSQIGGIPQAGDDPTEQASLKSSMNFGRSVTFDTDLRYVGRLPNPAIPAYAELNASLQWEIVDHVQLTFSGFNLLHKFHQEYPAPANAVPRSVLVGVRWRY